jgi:O-acetyl-ADP-ribose deacetylase
VIHTVGPVWKGGIHNEAGLLAGAYAESLKLAVENKVRTICFPSISTGAYGYPIEQAAEVALRAVIQFIKGGRGTVEVVTFVLYSGSALRVYQNALRALVPS